MKNMLIFTSLFINRIGNQSMLETIREYAKHYNIIIITSAPEEDKYYISIEDAKTMLPSNVSVYRTPQFIHKTFRKISNIRKLLKKEKIRKKINIELINLNYSFMNIMSFKVSYILQIIYSIFLIKINKINKPDILCAYEIGGVTASCFLSKIYKSNKIAKMQGTVLYKPLIENMLDKQNVQLDVEAYKRLKNFDFVTMTNDGTLGDIVLNYFNVKQEKYLFIPNGISKKMIEYKKCYVYNLNSSKEINLITISRLIGWKRVHLAIEIINNLVNIKGIKNIKLKIYGFGTSDEKKVLIDLIEKYDLNVNVSLCGEIEYHQVPLLFKDNDFLVSLYTMTNVTNPLLEAAFYNMPIISIRESNLINIVGDNIEDNIFLFNEDNELIDSISTFLTEMDIQDIRLKRKNMKKTNNLNLYSWKERIDKEIRILNEII